MRIKDILTEFAPGGGNGPDIKAKYLYNQEFLVTVDGQRYSFTVVNMERDFKNPELIKKAYINEPDGRSRLKPEYDDAKYYMFYIAEHLMQDVNGQEPSDDIQQAVAEYIDEYHQRDLAKVDDFHKKVHQKDPDFYHVTHQLPQPQSVSDYVSKNKDKGQDVEEAIDIGQEWMTDTELDQYVPDQLQQQWRELVGYDAEGNVSALWANITGGYEPDVNDPADRANMVKVANKWFAMKRIPNVRFFDVRDVGDELEWLVQIGAQGVSEGAGKNLSVEQLATISDAALDQVYGYGRSTPGKTFGWQANLMSAAYAKKMIDAGITDIERIADAIHRGWNVTAQKFVQDPDQFVDTEKLRAAGKLEAKLDQRAKLMRINYAQLPDDEQEKDRVVARALLQALTGAK